VWQLRFRTTLISHCVHAGVSSPQDNIVGPFAIASNGMFYFCGSTAAPGAGLWRSDGTPDGTVRVGSGTPGPGLWRSDGTPDGTVRVGSGTPACTNGSIAAMGDEVYFASLNAQPDICGQTFSSPICCSGKTCSPSPGLIRSDGTEAGTSVLRSFRLLPTQITATVCHS
jgi:ELWxxDGT repeat protein